MLQQTLSATPLNIYAPLLLMAAFGAYHGLNPGMGWLFALSLGLQRQDTKAIWVSMLPIAAGHALSLLVVSLLVIAGARFISIPTLEVITALVLIAFGLYKVFNYYRHPRWVGMKVGMRDLVWWSFLMAMAHGAGLMIAPLVLTMTSTQVAGVPTAEAAMVVSAGDHIHAVDQETMTAMANDHAAQAMAPGDGFSQATLSGASDHAAHGMALSDGLDQATSINAGDHAAHGMAQGSGLEVGLGIVVHTLSMLIIMTLIAWIVYKKFGLAILRQHWINFDLIWAAALLVVGVVALLGGFGIL